MFKKKLKIIYKRVLTNNYSNFLYEEVKKNIEKVYYIQHITYNMYQNCRLNNEIFWDNIKLLFLIIIIK